MAAAVLARKIRSQTWRESDRVPGNGSARAHLRECDICLRRCRLDTGRMRVPLGDEALREGHLDGDGSLARRIEIDDRRLHAQRAAEPGLGIDSAGALDKSGEFAGWRESEPLDGAAVIAGDGGEGAPFVDDQPRNGGLLLRER